MSDDWKARALAAEARLAEAVGLLRRCHDTLALCKLSIAKAIILDDVFAFVRKVAARPSPAPTEPAPIDGPIADLLRAQRNGQAPLCKYCGNQGADPFCRKCLRKASPPTEAPAPGTAHRCSMCKRPVPSMFWCPLHPFAPMEAAPGTEQKERP